MALETEQETFELIEYNQTAGTEGDLYQNDTQEIMPAEVAYENITSFDDLFVMDSINTVITFEDTNGTIEED